MPTGPCLCGDPYCGSCGGADAAMETMLDALIEELEKHKAHIGVINVLIALVEPLCKKFNDEIDNAVQDAVYGYQMEIDSLREELARIKESEKC